VTLKLIVKMDVPVILTRLLSEFVVVEWQIPTRMVTQRLTVRMDVPLMPTRLPLELADVEFLT